MLIKLDSFEDFRGHQYELYNQKEYAERGINVTFVQDNISISMKNVLRGIHGDAETWKLVSCLYGKLYFVVVNCDTVSPNFGQWEAFTLSDRNRLQVLVPPKYGNAHLVLSDLAVFYYKWSEYYDLSKQFTYRYDDKLFGIYWPAKNPTLSQRDEEASRLLKDYLI